MYLVNLLVRVIKLLVGLVNHEICIGNTLPGFQPYYTIEIVNLMIVFFSQPFLRFCQPSVYIVHPHCQLFGRCLVIFSVGLVNHLVGGKKIDYFVDLFHLCTVDMFRC
jgi:hypothetical protein